MNCMLHIFVPLLYTSIVIAQQKNLLIRLQCGDNAEYSTCASACTTATCDSLRYSSLKLHFRMSRSCVPSEQCCGENEEYTTCGSACAATCNDLRYPLPKPSKACILLCKSGCVCKKGFYRAYDSSCVAPDQCCGENESYKTCGSTCVETCDDKPNMCTKQCVAGCFCACSDYVRQNNSTGSSCIHRDDCSESCEEDE